MSAMLKFRSLAISVGLAVALVATPGYAKSFKIAVGDSSGSPQEALGNFFIEALEEKSDGKHTAQMFLNGQLGSEQDTVNDAAIGTLDMSILASNNLAPFSPPLGILSLPYAFQSLEQAEKITQGPIGEKLIEETIENAGVRILAWTYTGFRRLTNSQKPVTTVADLSDLVIRVPKNEIMIATYKAWGVDPTPMAWSETFTALQTKVVDGQDTPYMTINAMKFYEVQKYVTNLHYLFLIEPLVISESVFQDLSEADQKILLEAGAEATQKSATYLAESEAAIKEELVEKGMQLDDPANDEAEFMKLATEKVWPDFYESVGGVERLNEFLEALGRDPIEE